MNILEYQYYHEIFSHEDPNFPYNTYPCSIPLDFLQVPLHWHDEIEFIYIKKGSGIVTVNFEEYEVNAGSIILIIPGQLHSIRQLDNCTMEYENIIFHPDILISKTVDSCNTDFLLPLLSGKIEVPTIYKPETAFYDKIVSCIDANDKIRETFPQGYPLFLKGQLFILFYFLIEKCSITAAQEQKNKREYKHLKLILKYIENNYMYKITIADIAQKVQFSQSHFMKYFKKNMGTSFVDYLNDYRLTMAARLLRSSEASVLAISQEVGFENLSHFNRMFKKKYNMTPSAYRKQTST